MFRRVLVAAALTATALGMGAREAQAAAITYVGTSGTLSASATFDIVGGALQVTLTNTSANDVLVPTDVLTALFFTLAGDPTLAPDTALLAGGSTVVYDPDGQPAGGVVGGEWAYVDGLSGAPNGADEGISSSGFGIFGAANFQGANLAPPPNGALNGLEYGILSAGDNTATGNAGVTSSGGLIKNSVVFRLTGTLGNFNPATGISNVSFQYGTALNEPRIGPGDVRTGPGNVVPEPASLLLVGSGLILAARRMRRKT